MSSAPPVDRGATQWTASRRQGGSQFKTEATSGCMRSWRSADQRPAMNKIMALPVLHGRCSVQRLIQEC